MNAETYQIRRRWALALAAAVLLAAPWLWLTALDLLFPFPWERLQRPPAVVVTDRQGEPLRFFLPADQRWRLPIKLSELPPEVRRALVASEDQRFYHHPGVDPLALARALWANLRHRRVVSGASTISMQVARMADPGRRTLRSKLREAFIRTTLDRSMQSIAESQVARRVRELRDQGIGNAAVVVIDNQTRGVRALVGSSGYRDTYFQGQVNGAVARRSPGSTLKPFLYAMAMDQGRLVPDSYILDIPTDFAGYVAENYDQRYRGRVTVREALITSLNAPAVRLLAETGLGDFLHLLQRGGLSTLDRPPGRYGLPLILGAGEVRLLDLVNLYATMAQGGRHRPARIVEGDGKLHAEPDPIPLFSPEAARAVTEILT